MVLQMFGIWISAWTEWPPKTWEVDPTGPEKKPLGNAPGWEQLGNGPLVCGGRQHSPLWSQFYLQQQWQQKQGDRLSLSPLCTSPESLCFCCSKEFGWAIARHGAGVPERGPDRGSLAPWSPWNWRSLLLFWWEQKKTKSRSQILKHYFFCG